MLKLIAFIAFAVFAAKMAHSALNLEYKVIAMIGTSTTIVCTVAGDWNCLITALSGGFMAVGSAMNERD